MDFETGPRAAELTSPAIAAQHFVADLFVPPTPGPTDGTGLVRWVLNDPDSGSIEFEARAFGVVATITNSIANQNHPVEVDIACQDLTGDGCTASMGFASLNIAVYTP
jgi:hypothetical protein